MRIFYLFFFCFVCCTNLQLIAQESTATLYSKSFGDAKYPAIIFLHGGPGYNSFAFEASTAETLAKEGYYVIVFDQRGSGRSADVKDSKYTFAEAIADLDDVYQKYNIKKAALIGHSWGGTLGIKYAEKNPAKVKALILTGSPVDYQQTFRAIIAHSKAVYTAKKAEEQLKYIAMLETMDTTTMEYATYCFMHAMASGQYQAKSPAGNVKDIYQQMMAYPDSKYLSNMTQPPVAGFYANERYTMLRLYDNVIKLDKKLPVYAVYGKDDGLFDDVQLNAIKATVGVERFTLVDNASHNVFIDQQEVFINKIKEYIR